MDESQAWLLLWKLSDTPESCISASLDLQSGCWLWWPGVTRECPHTVRWPPGPGDQATVRRPPPAPSGRQNCHGVNEWNTFSLYRPDHLLNFYQSRYLHYTTTHLLSTSFHFSLALTQNQKHSRSFSWDSLKALFIDQRKVQSLEMVDPKDPKKQLQSSNGWYKRNAKIDGKSYIPFLT